MPCPGQLSLLAFFSVPTILKAVSWGSPQLHP